MSDRIRILRIIARLNIGGPAIHVTTLGTQLDPTRFESILVTGTENPGEGSMLEYVQEHGVQPVTVPQMRGVATFDPRDVFALVQVYRLIRKLRPHIVDTHTAKAGFLGRVAAHVAGVPVVVHTYHGHVLHGYYGAVRTRLLRRMEQWLAGYTDRIITVSTQIRDELIRYGVAPADKIDVVPLGFNLGPFLNSDRYEGTFRRELGLGDRARLVGIVGRIFPIKNHRLFLDAMAQLSPANPDAHFIIVGDGMLRAEMESRARRLGIADRTVFTGWRQDLAKIYADLDVLVVSSDNEGTPVSAIEAMASARPVVATRVGGLPDLVQEGRTGFLVPPRDPEAMARAVASLLKDAELRRRIGALGRVSAVARFKSERLVADMEALYVNLLKAKDASVGIQPAGATP